MPADGGTGRKRDKGKKFKGACRDFGGPDENVHCLFVVMASQVCTYVKT